MRMLVEDNCWDPQMKCESTWLFSAQLTFLSCKIRKTGIKSGVLTVTFVVGTTQMNWFLGFFWRYYPELLFCRLFKNIMKIYYVHVIGGGKKEQI